MNNSVKFNKYPSATTGNYLSYLAYWYAETVDLNYKSISVVGSNWNDEVGGKYNTAAKRAYNNFSSDLDREWEKLARHRVDFCPKEVYYQPQKNVIDALRFEEVL